MSHGILSLKLSEMDDQIARMHSRIQMSEALSPDRIHGEVQELKRECREREAFVRKSLECSRAREASVLLWAYERMEEVRRQAFHLLKEKSLESGKDEVAERKVLLAEYEIDFVMLAANRTLALSMEAIENQLKMQMEETDNR